MLTVIGLMFGGIIVGFAIRNYRLNFINHVITVLIWLLLFILGIEVGGNRQIINGLANLGMEAIVITIAAMLGSCMAAWLLWHTLYKRKKGEKT